MTLSGSPSVHADVAVVAAQGPAFEADIAPQIDGSFSDAQDLRWHILKTHGGLPVRFLGERIMCQASKAETTLMETHEIELFVTEAGRFVVSVNQLSVDGKRRSLSVFEAANANDIRAHVAGLDPLRGLPIPKAIIDGASIADMLTAHATLARRVEAVRTDLRELCVRVFAMHA